MAWVISRRFYLLNFPYYPSPKIKEVFINMKKGFTLIELLVVVLIIGILVGIALPQYRRAVEKSRATEAFLMIDSVEKAEDVYHMGHGRYTSNLDALDITVPTQTKNYKLDVSTRKGLKITVTRYKDGVPATGELAYRLLVSNFVDNYDERKAEWEAAELAKAEEDPEYEPIEFPEQRVTYASKLCIGASTYCSIFADAGYAPCSSVTTSYTNVDGVMTQINKCPDGLAIP